MQEMDGKIAALTNMGMLAVCELDIFDNRLFVNEQAAKMFGCAAGKHLNGIEMKEHFVENTCFIRMREVLLSCLTGAIHKYEETYRIRRGDGQVKWVKEQGVISEYNESGKPSKISMILFDMTKEKQKEEGLYADNEYRKKLAAMSGLGGWEWNIPEDRIYFNDEYRQMLGYLPEDIDGALQAACDKIVHPEDREGIMKVMNSYAEKTEGVLYHEMRLRHKNGYYIWMQDTGAITQWDESGKPILIIGSLLNIDSRKRAEQSLRKTNTAMFESNPHANLIFDRNLKVIDCNPVAVDVFGFKNKNDLFGKFDTLINEWVPRYYEDGKKVSLFLRKMGMALRNGKCNFEAELMIRGEKRPFNIICKRIPYNNDIAVVSYLIDLTKIRETQIEVKKRNHLLNIVNVIASSLMSVQPEGFQNTLQNAMYIICKSVNADHMQLRKNCIIDDKLCCKTLYQWTANENDEWKSSHEGILCYDSIPYWKEKMLNKEVLNSITKDLPEKEQTLLMQYGIKSILVIPIYLQDEFWGYIGYDDRQTEHTFSEEEERMLISGGNIIASAIIRNDSMAQLIEAKEEALNSSRAKTEFLSRMSHEIRTPMNAIIGMAAIARRTRDWERMEDCLKKIDASSQQLLGIINDILDMSKIDANKFEIAEVAFNFEKMIQNVQNVIQIKIEEKKQKFIYNFDKIYYREMIGDELRLSQVLLNLLSNAVKFTPDCGTITLRISESVVKDKKSILRIEVADDGIGISKERQEKLFESFEQADGSITRQFGGTGLGLAISKKIINLMGGNIWVESKEGEGSNFIIEMEVKWGEQNKPDQSMKQLKKGQRVLVIDDAQESLDYFSNILSEFSLNVETALNGTVAIEMVSENVKKKTPYDFILVDWHMPDMNGGETAKAIWEIMGSDVLIIMISVSDWLDIDVQAKTFGINHFLQKPVLPSSLYDELLQFTELNAEEKKENEIKIEQVDWSEKKILLVEDIEINREIVINLFEGTGVEIETAKDGLEAIHKYSSQPESFDLILMDVQMPILDGISATRKIRAMTFDNAGSIPIIAMTANAFKEDEQDCMDAGMNAHLAKPVEWEKFMKVLKQYL